MDKKTFYDEQDKAYDEESDGNFGGDSDENFFRGEIIYQEPEIDFDDETEDDNSSDEEYEFGQEEEYGDDIEEEGEFYLDAIQKSGHKSKTVKTRSENAKADRVKAGKKNGNDVKKQKTQNVSSGKKSVPDAGKPAGPARKKRRRKSKLAKWIRILLILAAVVLIGMFLIVNKVYDRMHYEPVASVQGESVKEDGVTNILLIGNDSRENGEDGRSDAMILLSISNKTKTIQMTSLLRDMYVEIPGHDGNRLNAAYAFGGPELLMETIEQNLGITVNRYVLVNFEAFANLVDAVGGVDLELTNEEVQYVNGYLVEYNMLTNRPEGTDYLDASLSGMIHLNGPQALAYSRNRYIGTDFGRTERQRKVLTGVIKNMPKALVKNPKQLVDGLLPNLTTNLTNGECYGLGLQAWKFLAYDVVQGSVPQEGTWQSVNIRGMSVLQVDFKANKEYLRESIYGE